MTQLRNTIKKLLLANQWSFLLLVVILLSIVAGAVNSRYWWVGNLTNLLGQISVLSLVACGATILIISGNFDISVGANIGLSSVVMAMLMRNGVFPPLGAFIGLLVSVLCASLIGAASILFQAPSFIISLAAIGVFQGVALFITQGTIQTIYGQFETLGGAKLFNVLPLLFIIALVGYLVVHVILAYTQLGRSIYAIGNNPRATYLAGINVNRKKLLFFSINGVFVGVAAMLLLSRVGAAQPSTGTGIELQAIGSVVIGGAPMSGGKGNALGTFCGVLLWGVIGNALNMMRVNPYIQDVVIGLLIILAVAVSSLRLRTEKATME
ncbi:MAG: ABC transporter permease [Verrucomicrobia bacterium]|nr:ABC transporter permease [Verrucomicrobiota bacterium]